MNPPTTLSVLVFGTLLFTLFAVFIILYIVVHKRKQFQHKLEKQHMEHQYQSELLQSRIEVQEQSFRYLSEEIHDNIGQVLSLVKLYLYKIAKNAHDAEVSKDVQECSGLMTKAITDLRNLSHTANGTYVLNSDLPEIIQKELTYISSAKEIDCKFKIDGNRYKLNEEHTLLVFRIIQEALSNALKHGTPTEVLINLLYATEHLNVSVSDNGSGFDMVDMKKDGMGLGLNNMRFRADLLKGKLDIQSEKGRGTTITLNLPVKNENTIRTN